jgi:hypothetical protein
MDHHLEDLRLVIAGGAFSLGGVLLGGLLATVTQLFLDWRRERRLAHRAKLLVAAELLNVQLALRGASVCKNWPSFEDLDAFLPTSAWRENRSSLAGNVSEGLWIELVMAYALLEMDRSRFALANELPTPKPLDPELAKGMKKTSNDLGRLRRQLGVGGGWLDEIEDEFGLKL